MFIKLKTRQNEDIWINKNKIIIMKKSGYEDAGTYLMVDGGEYVEAYHVLETPDQIQYLIK